jgi:ABC-type amino acid transport system permease subunit
MIIGITGILAVAAARRAAGAGAAVGHVHHQQVCVIFIEFIRGVPLITLLFVASRC